MHSELECFKCGARSTCKAVETGMVCGNQLSELSDEWLLGDGL